VYHSVDRFSSVAGDFRRRRGAASSWIVPVQKKFTVDDSNQSKT